MIALFLALLMSLPRETIYGPGAISYAPLEKVVARRHWQGTEQFGILIAPADCGLLGRWVYVISKTGVKLGLVVDCEDKKDAGQLARHGLLFDCNLKDEKGQAWFVVIPELK